MVRFLLLLGKSMTTMNFSGKKILIVDDNKDLTQIISIVLAGHGFEVLECAELEDGKHLVQNWQPDLLVLDINVNGHDGRSFCSELKQSNSCPVKIIMMSGYDHNLGAAIWHGADDFIAKPFGMDDLLGKVNLQLTNQFIENKQTTSSI
ncbi:MAG: response regulator transcription factor [Chitinophagaceae bacterium]